MKFKEWWTDEKLDMALSGVGQTMLGDREHWTNVVKHAYEAGLAEGQSRPHNPSLKADKLSSCKHVYKVALYNNSEVCINCGHVRPLAP